MVFFLCACLYSLHVYVFLVLFPFLLFVLFWFADFLDLPVCFLGVELDGWEMRRNWEEIREAKQ